MGVFNLQHDDILADIMNKPRKSAFIFFPNAS